MSIVIFGKLFFILRCKDIVFLSIFLIFPLLFSIIAIEDNDWKILIAIIETINK